MGLQLIPNNHALEIVEFDLTESENHSGQGTLTENPIEDGSVVADHLVRPPQVLTVQVCITNTPSKPTLDGQGATVVTAPLVYRPQPPNPQIALSLFGVSVSLDFGASAKQLPTSITGIGMPQNWDRVRRHFELLDRMRDQVVVMAVGTIRRYYEDMVLEGWTHDVDASNSLGKGVFNLSFKRLKIVQSLTVDAPDPKEPRGAPGAAKGSQATTPPAPPGSPDDQAKKRSIMKSLLDNPGQLLSNPLGVFGGG